jgi:SAM-dependent methyltransferase
VVAELGPGDSIGVGLAALLSGSHTYYAFDVKEYGSRAANESILEQLIDLFRRRAPRPIHGWPDYDHVLDGRLFPSHILTEERLAASMSEPRIEAIRRALRGEVDAGAPVRIEYQVPWMSVSVVKLGSVDLVLSHSVLEHVEDLAQAYSVAHDWLRSGGVMSHQIDFGSHGLAKEWNGYWSYPSWLWAGIRGRRSFLINRQPCSVHLDLIRRSGFNVVLEMRFIRQDGLPRESLVAPWNRLDDSDLICGGLFVQAEKGASHRNGLGAGMAGPTSCSGARTLLQTG